MSITARPGFFAKANWALLLSGPISSGDERGGRKIRVTKIPNFTPFRDTVVGWEVERDDEVNMLDSEDGWIRAQEYSNLANSKNEKESK